ncbi:MAG: hypothetical protein ACI81T_003022 [Bacteroidia bacterium]
MLLPNNILPKDSLYFNGGVILSELMEVKKIDFFDLYNIVDLKVGMTMSVFIFSLDWLYLAGIAKVDNGTNVELCI